MYIFVLEYMSQILLNDFKQLHGENYFNEMLFQMPLLTHAKINISDILQKDVIISDDDREFQERYAVVKKIK